MINEQKTKIYEECKKYLNRIDEDPNVITNSFDADTLALAVMFRKLPAEVSQINPEVIERVKSDALYGIFRDSVIKVAREKEWIGVIGLEQLGGKKFLNEKDIEVIRYNSRAKQTGGSSIDDYQVLADELIAIWKKYFSFNKEDKNGIEK